MTQTKTAPATANGNGGEKPDPLVAAIANEQEILEAANEIWGEETDLTPALYVQLRALARKPIPTGFITTVGVVQGKPYPSTGIKSVQVQMDRLDNVFRQFWGYSREFSHDGKLCEVTCWVGRSRDDFFVMRDSYGGVDRGSTQGNIYKGSFTNAGKPAFARIGPGWEIYVGAADFDPDTDEDAAKQQTPAEGATAAPQRLTAERAAKLEQIVTAAGLEQHLPMKIRGFGGYALTDLTVEQGMRIYEWAQQEITTATVDEESHA